jgi:hypothetical protein
MAFPLAHPAAVLPLRRFCPQWLSLPALMIGSLLPDAGYIFQKWHWDSFSHSFMGSIGFCLPVGIVVMVIFCALRSRVVRLLPAPYQAALLPGAQRSCGPVLGILISLLIGAWTHLFWDSCTHKDGWCVEHWPLLQMTVCRVANRAARVCTFVWYLSSFAGLVWLVLAFEKWKQTCVAGSARVPARVVLRDAVLIALLFVPAQLAHHLLRGWEPAFYGGAALCALLAMVIALRLRKGHQAGITHAPTAAGQNTT